MPYKDKEKQKEYLRKYNKKHLWLHRQRQDALLGTTSFKSNICKKKNGKPNWRQELKEIQMEKRRILFSKYKQYGNRRKYLRHNFLSTEET